MIPLLTLIVVFIACVILIQRSPCEGHLIQPNSNHLLVTKTGGEDKLNKACQDNKFILCDLTLILDNNKQQLFIADGDTVFVINYCDIQSIRMTTSTYFKHTIPSIIYFHLKSPSLPSVQIQLSDKITIWEMFKSKEKRDLLWVVYNTVNNLIQSNWNTNEEESNVYMR